MVLASGSTPIRLKRVPHDGKYIVDSWNALEFDAVPGRLGVIGAGVIGLGTRQRMAALGSEVTVLEALEQFLPMVDQSIAKEAQRHFKKQGLDIKLGAKVRAPRSKATPSMWSTADAQGEHTLQVDKLVVAVGRRPFTDGLLADGIGVQARCARLHRGGRTLPHRAYRTSGRWAMRCAAPCSRTRARKRA